MPPRPISSIISNCGKMGASCSMEGASPIPSRACFAVVPTPAMTHLRQRAPGGSSGMGDWHFGQIFRCVVVIHPSPERLRVAGYKVSANELEHRQKGFEARCNLSGGISQEEEMTTILIKSGSMKQDNTSTQFDAVGMTSSV